MKELVIGLEEGKIKDDSFQHHVKVRKLIRDLLLKAWMAFYLVTCVLLYFSSLRSFVTYSSDALG